METNHTCKGIGLLLREMTVYDAKDKCDGQLLEQFLVQIHQRMSASTRRKSPAHEPATSGHG